MTGTEGPRYRAPELRPPTWHERFTHLGRPEHLAAFAIALVVALSSGSSSVGITFIFLLLAALIAFAATEGSAPTGILASFVLMGVAASATANRDAPVWVYAAIGAAALVLNELLRIGAARRRRGEIDPTVLTRLVAVNLGSLVPLVGFVALVDATTERRQPDWDVVPVVFAVFAGLCSLVLWSAGRHRSDGDTHRWQPGRRLVSPPRPGYEPRRRR